MTTSTGLYLDAITAQTLCTVELELVEHITAHAHAYDTLADIIADVRATLGVGYTRPATVWLCQTCHIAYHEGTRQFAADITDYTSCGMVVHDDTCDLGHIDYSDKACAVYECQTTLAGARYRYAVHGYPYSTSNATLN